MLTKSFNQDIVSKQCEEKLAILPEPRNAEENAFINGLNTRMFKLGLTDRHNEGLWEWESDGTPVNYTNWAHGEPRKHDTSEDCVVMMRFWALTKGDRPDQWADVDCNHDKFQSVLNRNESKHLVCERGMF